MQFVTKHSQKWRADLFPCGNVQYGSCFPEIPLTWVPISSRQDPSVPKPMFKDNLKNGLFGSCAYDHHKTLMLFDENGLGPRESSEFILLQWFSMLCHF